MNRFISILTAIVCISLYSPETGAQDYTAPPVTVSKEKVRMGGKMYYSHIVIEKQTVYSISKAYGVTVEEIYAANPGLRENGLKKNAVILIPDPEALKQNQETEKPAAKDTNPDKKKKKKEETGEFFIHTVRWFEDLDVISEKYGVPVGTIMEINGLTGRKLKNKQKLRIPSDPSKYIKAEKAADTPAQDKATVPAQENQEEKQAAEDRKITFLPIFPKTSVQAVLMLPFNAQDSTGGSKNNLDFYSGALLAVKDMGEEGINVDLSVYDNAGGRLPITVERLEKSDFVIGPVSTGDLSRLLAITPQDTYVVSPLDHRAEALASTHRNLIQAPTPYSAQYADLVSWIKEDRKPEEPVLVIYEKGFQAFNEIKALDEKLKASGMNYRTFSYNILEGRNILDSLKAKMNKGAANHLLVASESEAFVNDVVRNINLMIHEKYDVVLYAPSRIRGFETIEVESLHNANLHVTTSYYIDYDDPKVMDFISRYRALFNTEPTPFAFQGYDITSYFVRLCSKYGEGWKNILPMEKSEMLQSGFRFERVKIGNSEIGYVNSAARRIIYGPDFSIRHSASL